MSWHEFSLITTGNQRGAMLIIYLFLLVFLIWKEIRRPGKSSLGLRIIFSILALSALLLIGLKPARRVEKDPVTAIYLTENYQQDILDSLLSTNNALVFSPPENNPEGNQVIEIPGAGFLARNYEQISRLYILGNGLKTDELKDITTFNTTFFLNELPLGITGLSYKRRIYNGEPLKINFTYNNENAEKWIFLQGPGGAVDSISINKKGSGIYSLQDKPKQSGKFLYYLIVKNDNGDSISTDIFPVLIEEKQPLSMVMITSFPNFETRYFKNWLEDNQHQVAIRSSISKNKYRFEFLNRDYQNLFRLDYQNLQEVDLLVVDGASLGAFTTAELEAIQQEIAGNGLGLLVQAYDQITNINIPAKYRSHFLDFNLLNSNNDFITIDGDFYRIATTGKVPITPFAIQDNLGVFPLYKDKAGSIAAAYKINGWGKIGINLIHNTYRLILEGKQELYAAHWSHMITQLARPDFEENIWTYPDLPFAFIDQPFEPVLKTSNKSPVGSYICPDSIKTNFYLQENVELPGKWSGKLWPTAKGWHQLNGEDSTQIDWFFAMDDQDWKSLRIANTIRMNRRWSIDNQVESSDADIKEYQQEPVSLLYLYLLFLISAAFLWLEPKIA